MNLFGGPLTSRDLTSLATRWITPELAAQQLIRRVSSPDGAAAMGRNGAGDYAGLAIPNFLPGELQPREYRLRRDHPEIEYRPDGSKREINRYLSPPGRANMAYFPVGITPEMLANVTLPVIVTEGEFKTIALWRLSLWQADRPRFLPVGLSGVWNWRGVIGKTVDADGARVDVKGAIADLGRIVCEKRQTLILFDSDLEDNESVRAARALLGRELRSRAANVAFFDWPKDRPEGSKGIDDWLCLAGPETVLPFVEAALDSAAAWGPGSNSGFSHSVRPEPPPTVAPWPDPLHQDAFHGIAGELVRNLEPHTEADTAALLLQFLSAWGSLIGRGPYFQVEADRHHTNLFVVIVGATSKGRKGTSWGRIRAVLEAVDEYWAENSIVRGLGSGEGLIDVIGAEGADKRCLIHEAEFARILAILSREGTTLSAVMRDAYDTGCLSINTRQKKLNVKGAHVSLIAHISRDELRRRLNDTELANGFANRDLWTCAARSKELPFGGGSPDLAPLIRRLCRAADFARKLGNTRVQMDQSARALWKDVYHDLSAARPGLLGDVTNRAEANTLRVALNYALLDESEEMCEPHLKAGLAVVPKYCFESARFIWGDVLGDPTADEILRVLRAAGAPGLTRLDIQNHFGRHKPATELDRAIGKLAESGLIKFRTEETGGRPVTRYWALVL
jgi:hypothetical protein